MRRLFAALLVALLALSALFLGGCQRKARVETGTRYVCVYGESLGSDVKEIEVPAKDAAKYSVTTKTILCSRHARAEQLYLRAQDAIKSGNLKDAKAALEAVLKLDSKFKNAPSQLADIAAGKKPSPDLAPVAGNPGSGGGNNNGSPGSTTTPDPGGSSPGMDAYRDLVPDVIEGFTAEAISAEELALTRAYVPKDARRYDQLVVMVQQYQSAGAATRALNAVMKSSYPANGTDVTVQGLKGYFGSNGQKFSVLSLVNGGVLVTLELHATGANPKDLRPDLERISGIVLD